MASITTEVESFMNNNREFFSKANHLITIIDEIIERICTLEPEICKSIINV